MDLWLKGHSGDPLRVDRKSRAPEYIPKPALSLGLVIQPQVLYSIAAAFVSFCGFCGLLRVPRPHCRPLATPPTR